MQLKYALTTLGLSTVPAAAARLYPRQNRGGNDPQSSLELDPSLLFPSTQKTGQEDPVDGQVASETSSNNFINYCLQFPDQPLTNGEQIQEGSCSQIPIGQIPAKDKVPAAFIFNPKNGDVIDEGTDINFQVKVINIETGHFTNAQLTYYNAPTRLNGQGLVIGHSHVVASPIDSLDDTTPKDVQTFSFFKGLNAAADGNGVMSALAAGGLKAGFYRVCSMTSNANHLPIVPAFAQRASGDDCIRFTVKAAGGGGNNNNAAAGGAAAGGAAANNGTAAGNAGAGQQQQGNGQQQQGGGRQRGQGRNRQQQQKRTTNLPVDAVGRRSFSTAGRSRIARAQ